MSTVIPSNEVQALNLKEVNRAFALVWTKFLQNEQSDPVVVDPTTGNVSIRINGDVVCTFKSDGIYNSSDVQVLAF
jgi:hypothetical protein